MVRKGGMLNDKYDLNVNWDIWHEEKGHGLISGCCYFHPLLAVPSQNSRTFDTSRPDTYSLFSHGQCNLPQPYSDSTAKAPHTFI